MRQSLISDMFFNSRYKDLIGLRHWRGHGRARKRDPSDSFTSGATDVARAVTSSGVAGGPPTSPWWWTIIRKTVKAFSPGKAQVIDREARR